MPSVLITGANRGLGFEFARQYSADGWRVFATCRNPIAAAALRDLTGTPKMVRLDVTDEVTIKEASRQIEEPIELLQDAAGAAREMPHG
jgi:NAD(P)-dependent dehydrogenase (short-subunit alcohol dehydrogenase family)